jgi:hypothetical protein
LRVVRNAQAIDTPLRQDQETPIEGVRTNIVQSIRAFCVSDLQEAAQSWPCILVRQFVQCTKQTGRARFDRGSSSLCLRHFGKNFDALYDCMTDPLHKSGPQPGFIVVLEHIPANVKFDKEAREQLPDIFREHGALLGRPQDTLPLLLFALLWPVLHTAGQAERMHEMTPEL